MHVQFINLDRSTDRLAEFKTVNAHLREVTRVPALDESRIDLRVLEQQNLIKGDILSMYPIGALCRALSDLAFWNRTIASGQPQTICDDDAIFNLQFDTVAPEVIKTLPPDWDLIVWGFNFDMFMIYDILPGVTPCVCQFDQAKMRPNTRAFQEMTITPVAQRLLWVFGMTSYSITPKGAQFLRSKCFPLQPMLVPCPEGYRTPPHSFHYRTVGIDNTINAFYKEMKAYVCLPPLVINKNEPSRSTIQSGGTGARPFQQPSAAAAPTNPEDMAALTKQFVELHKLGRFQEVLVVLDKMLALNPNSVETHYNRATILGDLNRPAEALAAYDKVLALKPDFVFALNNRGWVLQKLGRYDEALTSYQQALVVDPNYAAAKDNRDLLLKARQHAAG